MFDVIVRGFNVCSGVFGGLNDAAVSMLGV